ncbi:hypothetical protein Tco_1196932, partial [Tanacetum coccineum]
PVLAPEYPEYLAPFDNDLLPAEDELLPDFASATTLSPDHLVNSEQVDDDPEEDLVDYPSEEEEEEPSKEEEEEPLDPADSTSPVSDSVPSSEETEPLEEGETAATRPSPISPHTVVPLSQTRLPLSSPLLPLSSPLPLIPSPPLLLPSLDHRGIIPEADMLPRKKACFITPSFRFEIRESLAVTAARQPGSTLARGTNYRFMTALEEVKESVNDLASSHRLDSEEFYIHHQDAQDDRALLQVRISTLKRKRRYHHHMAMQQRRDDQDRWTRATGRIQEPERVRDLEHQDGPSNADSSC